jgi:hypothetical protein
VSRSASSSSAVASTSASGSRRRSCSARSPAARSAIDDVNGVTVIPYRQPIGVRRALGQPGRTRPAPRCRRSPAPTMNARRDRLPRHHQLRSHDGYQTHPTAQSGRWRRGSAFPLVAESLKLPRLIDPGRDTRVSPHARATHRHEQLALPNGPNGYLITRMHAGGSHRSDRERDLVLR